MISTFEIFRLDFQRPVKTCCLCNKVVLCLDIHLRKAHGIVDRLLRKVEINRQKERCVLAITYIGISDARLLTIKHLEFNRHCSHFKTSHHLKGAC